MGEERKAALIIRKMALQEKTIMSSVGISLSVDH